MVKRPAALLVTEYFPPTTGGVARWLGSLLAHARRYRWTVLTRPVAGEPEEDAFAGHRVLRPAWWNVPRSYGGLATLAVGLRLRRKIDRLLAETGSQRIDAMPVHFSALAAASPARKHGAELWVHLFGEELAMQARRPTRRALVARGLAAADRIVAISPMTKRLAEKAGAEARRILVACGIDISPFENLPPREAAKARFDASGRRVLLTVARIVPRKGHDLVVDAIPSLPPDVLYLVAGEGPARGELEARAAERGVAERVRFMGRVSEADLPVLYRAADVFVHPHREIAETGEVEGFGLVFLEAASAGVPSIAGASGSTADAEDAPVVHERTGLVVPPEAEAVRAAIARLLDDEALRKSLAEAAARRVREKFDIRAVAGRLGV